MFQSKDKGAAALNPAARTVLQQAANNPHPDAPSVTSETPSVGINTIELTKPITSHKGQLRELTLRPPTFADYIEIGDVDAVVASLGADNRPSEMRAVTNHDAMLKWAVALTGHDRVVLSHLTPGDAGELMRRVRLALAPFAQGNS